MLESLDNIAQPLLPIPVWISLPHLPYHAQDCQERSPLKEHYLLCPRLGAQYPQALFHNIQIRNKRIHNTAPRPIQALIPDTRSICPQPARKLFTPLFNSSCTIRDDLLPVVGLHKIHFVDETEDVGLGTVFGEGGDDGGIGG